MSGPRQDEQGVGTQVKRVEIVKRDAKGEIFEIIEGGEGVPTRVTFRREGEPPESYAQLGEENPCP